MARSAAAPDAPPTRRPASDALLVGRRISQAASAPRSRRKVQLWRLAAVVAKVEVTRRQRRARIGKPQPRPRPAGCSSTIAPRPRPTNRQPEAAEIRYRPCSDGACLACRAGPSSSAGACQPIRPAPRSGSPPRNSHNRLRSWGFLGLRQISLPVPLNVPRADSIIGRLRNRRGMPATPGPNADAAAGGTGAALVVRRGKVQASAPSALSR